MSKLPAEPEDGADEEYREQMLRSPELDIVIRYTPEIAYEINLGGRTCCPYMKEDRNGEYVRRSVLISKVEKLQKELKEAKASREIPLDTLADLRKVVNHAKAQGKFQVQYRIDHLERILDAVQPKDTGGSY